MAGFFGRYPLAPLRGGYKQKNLALALLGPRRGPQSSIRLIAGIQRPTLRVRGADPKTKDKQRRRKDNLKWIVGIFNIYITKPPDISETLASQNVGASPKKYGLNERPKDKVQFSFWVYIQEEEITNALNSTLYKIFFEL